MAVMSDSVVLTGLSPDTSRGIILTHFKMITKSSDSVQYVLHPFINDVTTAVVKFKTMQAVHDVVVQPNVINGMKVNVKMLPPQVYSRCHAVIDPFIVACLPNLKRNAQPLKDLGVELEANVKTGELRMTGSLVQLQCAQHVVHQMMLNQVESQERKLLFPHSSLGSSQDGPMTSTARSEMSTARSSAEVDVLQSITARSLDLAPPLTKAHFQRLTQSSPSVVNTAVPDWHPYAPVITAQNSLRNSQSSSGSLRHSHASTKSTLISPANSVDFSASFADDEPDKLDVDSSVFDYIVLKYSNEVLKIEHNCNVKMKYKRCGNVTKIMVVPQSEKTSHDIHGGKEQLIDLYKTIFFLVKKEVIAVDPATMKKDLFDKVINQVKQDYAEDLILAHQSDSTILLLGKEFFVAAATQYLVKMLGGKVRRSNGERRVQTAREDKPRMLFMMHSAPVSPVPSTLDPATSRSAMSTFRSTGRTRSLGEMSGLVVTGKSAPSARSSLSKSGSLRSSGSLRGSVRKSGSLDSMRQSGSLDRGQMKPKRGKGKTRMSQGTEVFYDSLDPATAAQASHNAAVAGRDMQRMLLSKQTKERAAGDGPSKFEFETPGGMKVTVATGSLTEEEVDVIVNPAREDLHLLNGVSESISEAAGPDMQRDCTQYMVKNGNLKVSDVMHTEATGLLKCYFVVHAVGPMWCLYLNKDKCHDALKDTFLNSLLYSQNALKAKSIAFPALGTGMFGIPLEVSCQAAYTAVQQFDAMNNWKPFLQEIKFIHQHEETTFSMGYTFQNLLREPANPAPSLTTMFGSSGDHQGTYGSNRSSVEGDKMEESARSNEFLQEFGSLISSARSDTLKTQQRQSAEEGFDTLVSKQVAKWAVPTTSLIDSEDYGQVDHTPFRQNSDTWNDFISDSNQKDSTERSVVHQDTHHTTQDLISFERNGHEINNLTSSQNWLEETPVLPMSSVDDSPPSSERSERSERVSSSRSEKNSSRSRSKKGKRSSSEGLNLSKGSKSNRDKMESKKGSGRIAASLWSSDDFEGQSSHGDDLLGDLGDSTRRTDTARSMKSTLEEQTTSPFQNEADEDTKRSVQSGTLTRLFRESFDKSEQLNSNPISYVDLHESANWSDVPAHLATPDIPASPASSMPYQNEAQWEHLNSGNEVTDQDNGNEHEAGTIIQPANGRMLFEVNRKIRLAGFTDVGTIVINYNFPSGKTQGVSYDSESFEAYLPYNQDGRTILTGFRKAFEDLRTFAVQREGKRGRLTWADVEHKTSLEEYNRHGFPDDYYMERVKMWLIEEGYG